MHEHSEANAKWEDQLQDLQQSNEYKDLFGIVGEPTEFEWHIFPGLTTLQILQKVQDIMEACQTSPEEFEDRMMFMFNDIVRTKTGNSTECFANSEKVQK